MSTEKNWLRRKANRITRQRAASNRAKRRRRSDVERLEQRTLLATWAGTLETDTTWTNDEVQVMNGDVTVAEGVTLTIEPGTVVKSTSFFNVEMFVNGTLRANGTAAQPITFTSLLDDSVGGDTNGDGGASAPGRGNWDNVWLNPSSTGNVLNHVRFQYGGADGGANLHVASSSTTISNSVFRESSTNGVRIMGAAPILTTNTFENNSGAAVSMDLASNPDISGVTIANNGTNGLNLDGGTISAAAFWDDPEITYRMTGDVIVEQGQTLTIGAGQVIKSTPFFNVELFVDGTLRADGTTNDPIVFTSILDDSVGGDTNNDADASAPGRGNWDAVWLRADSVNNVLDHVHISYGGADGGANLHVASSDSTTITNSSFSNSSTNGVRIVGSNPVLTSNTFENNASAAISMDPSSNPNISGVALDNNGTNGLNLDGGTITGAAFWDDPDITYRMTSDVIVDPGAVLTIGAGQVIKSTAFFNVELFVDGTLVADGTADAPIVFTSILDDAVGGDTNNDADASAPGRGNWDNVWLRATSTNNVLDHVRISYGGADGAGNLSLQSAGTTTITNSSFTESSTNGLRIVESNPVVTNNSFANNSGGAVSMDVNSNPDIVGVEVQNNGANGLNLDGGTLSGDGFWDDPDITYRMTGDVIVPQDITLTVGAGQVVKSTAFFNVELLVDGTLAADGTADAPIVFTSILDDAVGGDTNNDADASAPGRGNWDAVFLRGTSVENVLDHVRISYGGADGLGNLSLESAGTTTITNSSFTESSTNGVRIFESAPVMTNNAFANNNRAGVSMDVNSNPDIVGVDIQNNGTNGLNLSSGILSGDGFWDDPDITYRMTGDVTVPEGNTLTIGAGQVIKSTPFFNVELFVDGTLVADGTESAPIVFTSILDDAVGGDTNNDADASAPGRGNWDNVWLRETSTDNVLDHVRISYGGADGGGNLSLVSAGTTTITNSSFTESSTNGVRIFESNPVMNTNAFANNTRAAVSMDVNSNPAIAGVDIQNNGTNGLNLDGGELTDDGFWDDPDITYRMTGDVTVPEGNTLTIGAGQVIKSTAFFNVELIVDGTLVADGTAVAPIVFTSILDDTVGGDTNNDANASVPGRGNWDTVWLRDTSVDNVLDYVRIHYGGADGAANLSLVSAGTTAITNSSFTDSSTNGVRIFESTPVMQNNSFVNNTRGAVSMDVNSDPAIDGVIVSNNGTNGLVLDAGALTADQSWNDPDIVYLLTGDVTVPAGFTLSVEPGQIVKSTPFFNVDLIVDGRLNAEGTFNAPITFTSLLDDRVGGDTNNDRGASAPGRGNWDNVWLNANSADHRLDHVRMSYGGAGGAGTLISAATTATVSNTVIRDSASDAIHQSGAGTVDVTSSVLVNNNGDGLETVAGSLTAINNTIDDNHRGAVASGGSTTLVLTNNLMTGNRNSGVFSAGGATLTASYNDVFTPPGTPGYLGNYIGLADQTGLNGNSSVDPAYASACTFALNSGSPVIDAGFGDVAPVTDHRGSARADDPNVPNTGAGTPNFVDLGAFENLTLSPTSDLDGDGLLDIWETQGIDIDGDSVIDFDLPCLGSDPRHKDIFLEFDWMAGQEPRKDQIQLWKDAFANAPINAGGTPNPDGLPGINLWIDTGSLVDPGTGRLVGDNLGGGNAIPATDIDGLGSDENGNGTPDFYDIKQANFDASRRLVFRYALSARPNPGAPGGQAEIGGNDFIDFNHDAGTLMHELGHTLNLRHGGDENKNRKPNYVSIMNYDHAFGVHQVGFTRVIDYSPARRLDGGRGTGKLPDLVESNLNESTVLDAADASNLMIFTDAAGVRRVSRLDQFVDWNGDGVAGNAANLSQSIEGVSDGMANSTLRGHDDWSSIVLDFLSFGDSLDGPINPIPADDPFPTFRELVAVEVELGFLLPGDTDFDDDVDFADFLTLSANFGSQNTDWRYGDFTGDGQVAFADFLLLSGNFGKQLTAEQQALGLDAARADQMPFAPLAVIDTIFAADDEDEGEDEGEEADV